MVVVMVVVMMLVWLRNTKEEDGVGYF